MTVIVWDGKSLAADRRSCCGQLIRAKTKIWSVETPRGVALVGYSGEADAGEAVLSWFKAGMSPDGFPSSQRDKDQWSPLIAVWGNGEIWRFERTPHPIVFPSQHYAIGSGRDFALAALYCGKSVREAVEVASHFDSGCGNGVDVLTHGDA